MPTLTIVPQFASQTATGGRVSWTNTSNVNTYDDGNATTATAGTVPPNADAQTMTLSVPAQPIPPGSRITGVRFRALTLRSTASGGQLFQFTGPGGIIHSYFESSVTFAVREVGSLTTIAPNMSGLAWSSGFNITVDSTIYETGVSVSLDGVEITVVYTPPADSIATAVLLLDD
jgi:hypothetical protein